jgi:hypothetical protein
MKVTDAEARMKAAGQKPGPNMELSINPANQLSLKAETNNSHSAL